MSLKKNISDGCQKPLHIECGEFLISKKDVLNIFCDNWKRSLNKFPLMFEKLELLMNEVSSLKIVIENLKLANSVEFICIIINEINQRNTLKKNIIMHNTEQQKIDNYFKRRDHKSNLIH